jgi:flavodoxin I
MKAWVIYDSVFGNTEKVAQAIGAALGEQDDVDVFRASAQPPTLPASLDLVIVGSPTRQFRQTNTVRDYVKNLPDGGLKGIRVAAFDTRIALADINSAIGRFFVGRFGYAAKPIADGLKKKGGELAAPPEGFLVAGTEGPLKDGELQRAADWARQLAGK